MRHGRGRAEASTEALLPRAAQSGALRCTKAARPLIGPRPSALVNLRSELPRPLSGSPRKSTTRTWGRGDPNAVLRLHSCPKQVRGLVDASEQLHAAASEAGARPVE